MVLKNSFFSSALERLVPYVAGEQPKIEHLVKLNTNENPYPPSPRVVAAITAAAHKLARLIYAMLTKGEAYVDAGQDYFEERYRERVLRNLKQRAQQLGMQLTPAPAAATNAG